MGELGWELYVPSEFATGLFDTLLAHGETHGLKLGGMHAMDSLRIEKAYRHWGHDIADEDTPLEAGLGFAVAFDKNADFIGRDALLKQKAEKKLTKRLVHFALDDPAPLLYHEEPIYRDGAGGPYQLAAYGDHLGRASPWVMSGTRAAWSRLRRRRQMGHRCLPQRSRRRRASRLFDPTRRE